MTSCFIDSCLEHGNFLNTDISRCSAVTQLRCGRIVNEDFVANLLASESVSERILKIAPCGAGAPLPSFSHPCPFTSPSFALFYVSHFPFLIRFTYFLLSSFPSPFLPE